MLKLNDDLDLQDNTSTWKVLIYDKRGCDIIAPILKLGTLKDYGITLCKHISLPRHPIPDVPAIYFVEPTDENIEWIIGDAKKGMYETMYINFISYLPEEKLEKLASKAVEHNCFNKIAKIYDQYMDYVSLEEDLFSLEMRDSYLKINSTTEDKEAEKLVEMIADRLFCMISTLRKIPILRAAPDGAASMIANKLDQKIRESLLKPSNPFTDEDTTFERPVLILVDRSFDYKMMFFHPWIYQAVVHDLFHLHLNKISFSSSPSSSSKTSKNDISLDSSIDVFWKQNRNIEWPSVSPHITEMLKEISMTLKSIELLESGNNTGGGNSEEILNKVKDLGQLVSSVPQLERTKIQLSTHTNICESVLQQVQERELDKFYQAERSCIFNEKSKSNEDFLLLFKSSHASLLDKLRLFLIHILSSSFHSSSFPQYKEQFDLLFSPNSPNSSSSLDPNNSSTGNNNNNNINKNSSTGNSNSSGKKSKEEEKIEERYSKIIEYLWKGKEMSKLTKHSSKDKSSITKFMNNISTSLLKGSNEKTCEMGVMVQELVNITDSFAQKTFLYLDPKVSSSSSIPRKSTPFSQAILFVVGGGSYSEYLNIADSLKGKTSFIYGSTDLPSPTQFLHQIANLN